MKSDYNVKRGTECCFLDNYLMIHTSLRHLYMKCFIKDKKNHQRRVSSYEIFLAIFHLYIRIP